MKAKVERLKKIKEELNKLNTERESIENELDDLVIFQNSDGTWTRFTKIDNVEELKKGPVFRASQMHRYTTKLETLKNEPKELKQAD